MFEGILYEMRSTMSRKHFVMFPSVSDIRFVSQQGDPEMAVSALKIPALMDRQAFPTKFRSSHQSGQSQRPGRES